MTLPPVAHDPCAGMAFKGEHYELYGYFCSWQVLKTSLQSGGCSLQFIFIDLRFTTVYILHLFRPKVLYSFTANPTLLITFQLIF